MTKRCQCKSYAKINLSLDVLGKRADGYHELAMIMHTVDVYDIITIEVTKGAGIVTKSNTESIPHSGKNIAHKAAKMFMEEIRDRSRVNIYITKKIPVGGGMGGGSSNAASVLKMLNTMYDKPLDDNELLKMCAALGADVPFCYMGGTALATGIGTVLTPIPYNLNNIDYKFAFSKQSVSTKTVYSKLDISDMGKRPNIDKVVLGLEQGDAEMVAYHSANVLESVTLKLRPDLLEVKNNFKNMGALFTLMSGSGPTVYAAFPT